MQTEPSPNASSLIWRAAAVAVIALFAVSCASTNQPVDDAAASSVTETTTLAPERDATGSIAPPTSDAQVEMLVDINTHCGAKYLSLVLEGKQWWNPDAPEGVDWVPVEWSDNRATQVLEIAVVFSEDGSELIATREGHSVTYVPVPAETAPRLCA